jgi:two-component system alkaline phosphatase synthesis response regulator PhoP
MAAGRKLLFVDDEICLAELAAHAMSKAGYAVLTAEDGEQGYELACRELPDLVVTDHLMPQLDGLQMAALLRETANTGNIPLILLTCRGTVVSPAALAKTNVRELVAKPFSAKQLKLKIEAILNATAPRAA